MKKPFTLYKLSTTKLNKYVYYVRFRDADVNSLPGRSSGKTSKNAAEAWAIKQLQEGTIKSTKEPKFSVFAQNWFVWGEMLIPQKATKQERGLFPQIRR